MRMLWYVNIYYLHHSTSSFYNFHHLLQFGFTLDRTLSDAMNPYLESHDKCLLRGPVNTKSDYEQRDETAVIYFTFDLKNLL